LAALPDEDHSQVTPEQVIDALSKAFKAVDDAVCKVPPHPPHFSL
jgi:hypothetical protein